MNMITEADRLNTVDVVLTTHLYDCLPAGSRPSLLRPARRRWLGFAAQRRRPEGLHHRLVCLNVRPLQQVDAGGDGGEHLVGGAGAATRRLGRHSEGRRVGLQGCSAHPGLPACRPVSLCPRNTLASAKQLCILHHAVLCCMTPCYGRPTSSIVSLMLFGLPGRLRMRLLPRRPAVWRDSTAVGTYRRLHERGGGKRGSSCLNAIPAECNIRRGARHEEELSQASSLAAPPSPPPPPLSPPHTPPLPPPRPAPPHLMARICSPYPGIMRSHTCSQSGRRRGTAAAVG